MSDVVLIIEDSKDMHNLVKFHVRDEDWHLEHAYDGTTGLTMARSLEPTLILLDLDLPDISGIEVCQELQTNPTLKKIPVIFISSHTAVVEIASALDAGGNDYITKPFSPRLLIERIRAVLRRSDPEGADAAGHKEMIVRGDLVLDASRHLCTWRDEPAHLTVTEFLILNALAARPGLVKSRDQLIDAAYGEHAYVDDRTIDSHIKRLRGKFRALDSKFAQIETLYGIGYRYRDK